MLGRVLTGVLGLLVASAAVADAPSSSVRPMARPGVVALADPAVVGVTAQVAPIGALARSLRPMPRPIAVTASVPVASDVMVATASGAIEPREVATRQIEARQAEPRQAGLFGFLRPSKRPEGLAERQLVAATRTPVAPGKPGVVSRKGAVCNNPAIQGEALAPITSRVQGCGVANPVRVTSVSGVRLSQPATMDCDTARALNTWVERGVERAYGRGKVVEMQVAGHYICRTRNHRPGAKISEHGRGRAIDISGFTLSNGKTVTVARNFDRTMRKAHKAACGIFKTTLGPGSDGMHEDHLHLDVAKRGGTYCR